MPLDVSAQLSPSNPNLPQTGGVVTVTFQARSIPSPSRLRAAYSIPPGSATFQIAGSSTLGPQAVGTGTFTAFPKQLDIRPLPGVPPGPTVVIDALVQEVDSGGNAISAPRPAQCVLNVRRAAAKSLRAASANSSLGQRLLSFRRSAGLSQAEIARQLGVSRSTVSRVERGQEPSDRMANAIQTMIQRS